MLSRIHIYVYNVCAKNRCYCYVFFIFVILTIYDCKIVNLACEHYICIFTRKNIIGNKHSSEEKRDKK